MDRPKLGKPVRAELKRNCMLCTRWLLCRDPAKDMNYACSRFATELEGSILDVMEREQEESDREHRKNKKKHQFINSYRNTDLEITDEIIKSDSISDLIKEALQSDSPVAPDLRFDDRDMRRARNVIEWIISPKFTGGDAEPFAKQMQVLAHMTAEWCPHCSDEDYFENVPTKHSPDQVMSRVVFLEKGKCPKCKATKSELILDDEILLSPYEMVGIVGQRGTKSTTTASLESYMIANWALTPNLPAMYKTKRSSVFTCTYTATTFGQAKSSFWDPLNVILTDSEWFRDFHSMLRDIEHRTGEELYKHSETILAYRHKNIFCSPAAPSQRSLRGRCIIGSTIVNTNSGFVHMNEVIKNEGYIKSRGTSIDSPFGQKDVSHFFKAKDKTIKVVTKNGYSVEGTAEHPLLVLCSNLTFKWKRLDELKKGDWIVSKTRYNKPLFGTNEITKEHASLLGYYTANGYRDEISTNDARVVNRLKKNVKKLYNGKIKVYSADRNLRADKVSLLGPGSGHKGWTFKSRFVTPYMDCHDSSDKEIPFSVRTAPSDILHEYLESYFECDCGINGGNTINGSPSEIEVSTSSEKLAHQLHIILLQVYDIVGRLNKFKAPKIKTDIRQHTHDHYKITITGGDAYKFIKTFKRAKVQKYADRIRDIPSGFLSDRRLVPYIRSHIWATYQKQRVFSKNGGKTINIKLEDGTIVPNSNSLKPLCVHGIRQSNKRWRTPSPEFSVYADAWEPKLKRLKELDSKLAKKVNKLLKLGAHFEQITHITVGSSKKWVYDFTVPEGHAFTANGLSSHNTRISAIIDEAGWFKLGQTKGGGDREQMNGMEVFTALKRSLRTMTTAYKMRLEQGYNNHPRPYLGMISSPSALTDLIMTRFKKVQGSREVYSFKYPTWKFNPLLPKSEFKEEFRTDPVQAARDYACEPPISKSPWIADIRLIEDSFSGKRNAIDVQTKRIRTRSGRIATSGNYLRRIKKIPYEGEGGAILGLDMGFNNNSLAFCIAHPTSIPDREDDEEEDILIGMDIIAIGELIPRKERPINNSNVYKNIIQPLCSEFGIAHVVADRWESRTIMQDLEDSLGISYTQLSVDMQDFKDYKEGMYSQLITHPRLEDSLEDALQIEMDDYPLCFKNKPASHLAFQMATVQDTGNAVIKGENNTTDDILRACVVAYAGLQDEEILEDILNFDWGVDFIPKISMGHVTVATNGTKNSTSVQGIAIRGGAHRGGYSPSNMGVIGRR